ncbi:MAG: hypothetical protein KF881_01780 [Acidobacteria bacterium]|nr:hypothetical protein [Acidobacteriota bacterium]
MRGVLFIIFLLLLPVSPCSVFAQETGALDVTGRVRIGKAQEKIVRKRFYLFKGGLTANKDLVERIKNSQSTTRDCFYCGLKASSEYINWLRAEDCESPYCREITEADVAKVPEFQAAYTKSLRQYGNRPAVARKWLTTNLAPELRDGFYRSHKADLAKVLGDQKPLQSSMTDSVSVRATFIDLPIAAGAKNETYLISNILPIVIKDKSYIWICEADVNSAKRTNLVLQVPDGDKPVRRCEVIVRDVPQCKEGTCSAK